MIHIQHVHSCIALSASVRGPASIGSLKNRPRNRLILDCPQGISFWFDILRPESTSTPTGGSVAPIMRILSFRRTILLSPVATCRFCMLVMRSLSSRHTHHVLVEKSLSTELEHLLPAHHDFACQKTSNSDVQYDYTLHFTLFKALTLLKASSSAYCSYHLVGRYPTQSRSTFHSVQGSRSTHTSAPRSLTSSKDSHFTLLGLSHYSRLPHNPRLSVCTAHVSVPC